MNFTIWSANVLGNESNCIYPNEHIVSDEESLKHAIGRDYVCAKYKNNYRKNDNFIMSDCLPFDFDNIHSDNPSEWVTVEVLKELFPDVEFAIHYSRNHNKDKDNSSPRPRFHALFPIPTVKDYKEYADLKKQVLFLFPYADTNAIDVARFFFGTESLKVEIHEGKKSILEYLHDFDEDMEQGDYGDHPIFEGSRNSYMSRIAGKLIVRYGTNPESYKKFLQAAERCSPPLAEMELNKIWRSAAQFGKRVSQQEGYIKPEDYNKEFLLKPEDFSDIGQAKVLVREYAGILTFTPSTDYLCYDGKRWCESKQLAVGVCEQFLDRQLEEAESALKKSKEELIKFGLSDELINAGGKTLEKSIDTNSEKAYKGYLVAVSYRNFILKRRDMKYVMSALQAAKPMLLKDITDFDKNEFFLNTPAGTIDLRTGETHEHYADDFITMITSVSPGNDNEQLWRDAVGNFFCGDVELMEYVQQIVGISAIGKVYIEALVIAYGEGQNGKSTFWNTIARVLGSYSGTLSSDALTAGVRRNISPEKAELRGKRLVIAAELEEGVRLSTSTVKQLCSTDEVQAEKKYKDPFKYIPSHTLILYTNHLPRVGASDEGTWRRLVVIPFDAKIEKNTDIKNYADYLFQNAGGAVLAWIIEGARKAIAAKFKLSVPTVVEQAIGRYRESNDWLSDFIDECCELDPSYQQKSGEFYQEYRSYCARVGDYTRSTADFYNNIEQAGFHRRKTKKGIFIFGIRIKSDFLSD